MAVFTSVAGFGFKFDDGNFGAPALFEHLAGNFGPRNKGCAHGGFAAIVDEEDFGKHYFTTLVGG